MARHPEVSDESIINAGKTIERSGKTPNPGAIRAQLGYRGGLLRIKTVWNEYQQAREDKLYSSNTKESCFDELPEEYAANAGTLIYNVQKALEQLFVEAYLKSRDIFEARLAKIEKVHEERLAQFASAETDADACITQLEKDVKAQSSECDKLAKQNATLLIENSELRGRLAVFESDYGKPKSVLHESKEAK